MGILVIGNGFDLACGLRSKFSDYVEYLHDEKREDVSKTLLNYYNGCLSNARRLPTASPFPKKLDCIEEKVVNSNAPEIADAEIRTFTKDCKDENTWDLIFLTMAVAYASGLDEFRWLDVEKAIHDIVFDVANSEYNIFRPRNAKSKPGYIDSVRSFLVYALSCALENDDDNDSSPVTPISKTNNRLLKELKAFEEKFSKYLNGLVDGNEEYFRKAEKLLKKLESEFNETANPDYYLVSFNYINYEDYRLTSPSAKRLLENVTLSNIHGCTGKDGKVLLGITPNEDEFAELNKDGRLVLKDPDSRSKYAFAKEFRRIDFLETSGNHKLPMQKDDVIFYGSSLSEQDYHTIFRIFDMVWGDKQSVFDGIDSDKHSIKFVYSFYGNKPKEDIMQDKYLEVKNAVFEWQRQRGFKWRNVFDDLVDLNRLYITRIDID